MIDDEANESYVSHLGCFSLGLESNSDPVSLDSLLVINSLLSLQMNSLVSLLETIIITLGELFVRFI
jgi:hypothetical protein